MEEPLLPVEATPAEAAEATDSTSAAAAPMAAAAPAAPVAPAVHPAGPPATLSLTELAARLDLLATHSGPQLARDPSLTPLWPHEPLLAPEPSSAATSPPAPSASPGAPTAFGEPMPGPEAPEAASSASEPESLNSEVGAIPDAEPAPEAPAAPFLPLAPAAVAPNPAAPSEEPPAPFAPASSEELSAAGLLPGPLVPEATSQVQPAQGSAPAAPDLAQALVEPPVSKEAAIAPLLEPMPEPPVEPAASVVPAASSILTPEVAPATLPESPSPVESSSPPPLAPLPAVPSMLHRVLARRLAGEPSWLAALALVLAGAALHYYPPLLSALALVVAVIATRGRGDSRRVLAVVAMLALAGNVAYLLRPVATPARPRAAPLAGLPCGSAADAAALQASAPSDVPTMLSLTGPVGEPVLGGCQAQLTDATDVAQLQTYPDGAVQVNFGARGMDAVVALAPSRSAQLASGSFPAAMFGKQTDGQVGLSVSLRGRRCKALDAGAVVIYELRRSPAGVVLALQAAFEQRCQGTSDVLRGLVRYHAGATALAPGASPAPTP